MSDDYGTWITQEPAGLITRHALLLFSLPFIVAIMVIALILMFVD